MAISTTPASGELRLALDDILVGDNVRDLVEAHVDNLAQWIALREADRRTGEGWRQAIERVMAAPRRPIRRSACCKRGSSGARPPVTSGRVALAA
jgi:hypothetical protein